MLKSPHLAKSDIEEFQECGFLALKNAFSPAEAKAIQDWTAELAARPEAPGTHWVYHEESQLEAGVQLINRIENMTPYHTGMAELANVLIPGAGQLLGEDAVLFKDKINFKMSGGEGFEPHQDSQAGWEGLCRLLHQRHGLHRCRDARKWLPAVGQARWHRIGRARMGAAERSANRIDDVRAVADRARRFNLLR
jgi:hypothetical protein